jgi:hypothetical protein
LHAVPADGAFPRIKSGCSQRWDARWFSVRHDSEI